MVELLKVLEEEAVRHVVAAPGGDLVLLHIGDELIGVDLDGARTGSSMKVEPFYLHAAAAQTRRFAYVSRDVVHVHDATGEPILAQEIEDGVRGLAFDRTGTVLFVAAQDNAVHAFWLDSKLADALDIDWLPEHLVSDPPTVYGGHAEYGSHSCYLLTDWGADHTVAVCAVATRSRDSWGGYTRYARLRANDSLESDPFIELTDPLAPIHLQGRYFGAHTLQLDCSDARALFVVSESCVERTLKVDAVALPQPGCSTRGRFAVRTQSSSLRIYDQHEDGAVVERCSLASVTATLLASDRVIVGGGSHVQIWSI